MNTTRGFYAAHFRFMEVGLRARLGTTGADYQKSTWLIIRCHESAEDTQLTSVNIRKLEQQKENPPHEVKRKETNTLTKEVHLVANDWF